jgi:hypothetical protein
LESLFSWTGNLQGFGPLRLSLAGRRSGPMEVRPCTPMYSFMIEEYPVPVHGYREYQNMHRTAVPVYRRRRCRGGTSGSSTMGVQSSGHGRGRLLMCLRSCMPAHACMLSPGVPFKRHKKTSLISIISITARATGTVGRRRRRTPRRSVHSLQCTRYRV